MRYSRRQATNQPNGKACLTPSMELTRTGMLDARGSDFYMLTERGKGTIAQS